MAGLIGHTGVTNGLFQHLLSQERAVKSDTQEAALEAAIEGQKAATWVIDNVESSLKPGKKGRNWTFNMRNSLDSKVDRSGNTISIRVGWLANKEGYFLLQEHGGELNGIEIKPMEALMAGHEEILKTLSRWGVKVS